MLTKEFQSLVKDPTDLKKQCLCLCQQYLAGNWTKLTLDDMEIKRISGGMMNMVYHCKIPDNLRDESTEPKEVAIRLYGNKYDFKTLKMTDNTLEDNIKYLLLSESGFGPKVYGVAPTGVIQKYYKVILNIRMNFKFLRLHSTASSLKKTYMTKVCWVSWRLNLLVFIQ